MSLEWPVIAISGNDRWARTFSSEDDLRVAMTARPELRGRVDFYDARATRARVGAGGDLLVPDRRYAGHPAALRRRISGVLGAGIQRAEVPDLIGLFAEPEPPTAPTAVPGGGPVLALAAGHRCNFFCRLFRH
ncbi:hypothetical protein GCM10010124_12360 [Pilimelia terevasa]|uniref:Uncharacterized protein n=1 Tax=Pilimelia terevasa TaxID=53372 RepID=A0A8J3BMA5_9ACTN|nr:hypothetical protein [Pilimelia terevasa]GGK21444.1 hypothetical protein GCM10010124_12360 [Pilimelia terevasa]